MMLTPILLLMWRGEKINMEIIRDIASIVGLILALISLITIFTKGGRALIYKWIKSNTQDLQSTNQKQTQDIEEIKCTLKTLSEQFSYLSKDDLIIKDILMQQCRNTVKDIYYKYNQVKKIPLYERKTVDKTYEIYHDQLGGNSYVQLLYNEIKKWEIDPNHPSIDEE